MFLTNHSSAFLLHDVRVVKNVACLSHLVTSRIYIADCQLIQTKMLYTYLTRFRVRFVIKSFCLFLGIHYTWLWYSNYISKNSYGKRSPAVVGSQLNRSFLMNLTTLPRCKTPVFVVIVVFSSPKNIEKRSVIRSTWAEIKDTDSIITNIANEGSYSNPKRLVKTVFLLGKPDKKTQSSTEIESEYHSDLVFGSFKDSYGNLTLKAKLGLEWAHKFCNFKYYLKTDDDVFVYSKGLVKWLWQLPREGVYTGRCDFNKAVIRTSGHKW